MEDKVKLTGKEILEKKFTKDVKGYNPDEVDAFLDEVIADYANFAAYQKESSAYIGTLEKKIQEEEAKVRSFQSQSKTLWEENKQLEIDNASYKKRLDGIKPGDKPTAENLDYIKRINQLETFLFNHGFKESDLDKKPEQ
jgi:DivIVA domain-containing protein